MSARALKGPTSKCYHVEIRILTQEFWRCLHIQSIALELGFPGGSASSLPAMLETWVQSLDQEDPLEKEMAIHSGILAWKILWTGEPGGLHILGVAKSWTWLSNWLYQIRWRHIEDASGSVHISCSLPLPAHPASLPVQPLWWGSSELLSVPKPQCLPLASLTTSDHSLPFRLPR